MGGCWWQFRPSYPIFLIWQVHIDISLWLSFSLNKVARTLLDKTGLIEVVTIGLGIIVRITSIKESIMAYRLQIKKI